MNKLNFISGIIFIFFVSGCGAGQIEKDVKEFLKCRATTISFKEGEDIKMNRVQNYLVKFGMIQINQATKKCELTRKGRENYFQNASCEGNSGIVNTDLELIDIEQKETGKSNGIKKYVLIIKYKITVRPWLKDEYQKSTDSYMKALFKNIIADDGKVDTISISYPFQR